MAICVDARVAMRVDACVVMYMGARVRARATVCVDVCADVCLDMCADMRVDLYADMRRSVCSHVYRHVYRHVFRHLYMVEVSAAVRVDELAQFGHGITPNLLADPERTPACQHYFGANNVLVPTVLGAPTLLGLPTLLGMPTLLGGATR